MEVRICLSKPLELRALSLPADLKCRIDSGCHTFRINGRVSLADSDGVVRIPAWHVFDCHIAPGSEGCARGAWYIDVTAMGTSDAPATKRERQRIVQIVSRQIFCDPNYKWTCEDFAQQFGCTQQKLRALIFSQSESLTHIALKQRLLRAMLALLNDRVLTEAIFRLPGLTSARRLAAALEAELSIRLPELLDALPVTRMADDDATVLPGFFHDPQANHSVDACRQMSAGSAAELDTAGLIDRCIEGGYGATRIM